MKITFDDKTHTYFVDGDIASISVTELLHKHGLAPDYSGIDKDTLSDKAAKGKEIHEGLAKVLTNASYAPTSPYEESFDKWVKKNIDCAAAEMLLAHIYGGMIIAGTADVIGFLKDGTPFVADHKITSKLNKEYVTWQTNIYDYFARRLSDKNVNGSMFYWNGAKKFFCFHYNDKGELNVVELEKIPDTEIEKLICAELKNEKYQRPQLVVDDELKAAVEKAELALIEIQTAEKAAKANADKLRAELLEAMKKQKIKTWETDKVKITYIEPVDRLTVDNKKLKEKYPAAFSDCQKLTKVKETLRISIRENDNE